MSVNGFLFCFNATFQPDFIFKKIRFPTSFEKYTNTVSEFPHDKSCQDLSNSYSF